MRTVHEVCENCAWEGEVPTNNAYEYEWMCPACEYEHLTENDEDVGRDIERAWAREAGMPRKGACGTCESITPCPHDGQEG